MGGHGGLNILPQKRWNVYNRDNRERVARDEAAAAREEALRADAARREASAARIDALRKSRGVQQIDADAAAAGGDADGVATAAVADEVAAVPATSRAGFLDLTTDFASLGSSDGARGAGRNPNSEGNPNPNSHKRKRKDDEPKKRKDEEPRVIGPDEEKCRLGYGIAGKGVAAPWYMARPQAAEEVRSSDGVEEKVGAKSNGRKTVQELREERMKREKKEKERERALLASAAAKDSAMNRGFSKHRTR